MKELLNSLQTKCKGLKAHEFVSVQVADMQQILFALELLDSKQLYVSVQQFGRAFRHNNKPVVVNDIVNAICSGPGECVACDGECLGIQTQAVYSVGKGEKE